MEKFNGLSLEAHRMASIVQIENLMARHTYYHASCMNAEELRDIWSKEQADETSWQQNFGMWKSMAHLSPYYGEGHDITGRAVKEQAIEAHPELAERIRNVDGRRMMEMPTHTLTTSIIEIAADGMSAKGLWYTPGFAIRRDYIREEASACWMWEKYGADFVYENGQWKFLHIQIGMDMMANFGEDWTKPRRPMGPPPEEKKPAKGPDGKEMHKAPSMGGKISQPPDGPGKYQIYAPTRVPQEYPEMPKPYETLSKTFSY